jgi:hypothetical protein
MPRRRDATLLPWILCLIALACAAGWVVWWVNGERKAASVQAFHGP